jgi:hypothetical protein
LTKAVRLDNADVPVHLWDEAVCRRTPSKEQVLALDAFRVFFLRTYQRKLRMKTRAYLNKTHGKVKHLHNKYREAVKCLLKPLRNEL